MSASVWANVLSRNGGLQGYKLASLRDKKIILGVTGGIAAYKAAELVRLLMAEGAQVRVVMTEAATKFVAPLTFQALSGQPVHVDLVDEGSEAAMGHIALARWADLIVVAPMTADFMARVVHGRADDLLSALCLATEANIWLAPAMNSKMWLNEATQDNVHALTKRGVRILGPAEGEQACGETGLGRMVEPVEIVNLLSGALAPGSMQGWRVVITAGPTREPIDPVRYISNRSSGKMGFALAEMAVEAGAEVVLISGPVSLVTPSGVSRVDVGTAEEMAVATRHAVQACDIFISAAAVADYRLETVAEHKIKKNTDTLTITLLRNPDILSELSLTQKIPFVVGFAAETEQLVYNARNKLRRKCLDMVVANDVSQADRGFDVDVNQATVVWPSGEMELPLMSKRALARRLIEIIAERYHAKSTN